MKNKKGQMMGTILGVFMLVIVGLALLPAAAQIIGDASNSVQANNVTYTAAANGSWIDLAGQELLSAGIVIHNVTNSPVSHGGLVPVGNFTRVERVSDITGVKTVGLQTTDPLYAGATLNVTYTYGLDGYIENAGARSVAALVTIFFALAIAVVALTPTLRSGVLQMMGR